MSRSKNGAPTDAGRVVPRHLGAELAKRRLTGEIEDAPNRFFVGALSEASEVVGLARARNETQPELRRGGVNSEARIGAASGNGCSHGKTRELLIAVAANVGRPQTRLAQQRAEPPAPAQA